MESRLLAYGADEMNILAIRNIKISDLPDGYYKEQLSTFVKDPAADVNVVATGGGAKDWTCYCGWPEYEQIKPELIAKIGAGYYCSAVRTVEGVSRYGDKFSEKEALILFPQFSHLVYRP